MLDSGSILGLILGWGVTVFLLSFSLFNEKQNDVYIDLFYKIPIFLSNIFNYGRSTNCLTHENAGLWALVVVFVSFVLLFRDKSKPHVHVTTCTTPLLNCSKIRAILFFFCKNPLTFSLLSPSPATTAAECQKPRALPETSPNLGVLWGFWRQGFRWGEVFGGCRVSTGGGSATQGWATFFSSFLSLLGLYF